MGWSAVLHRYRHGVDACLGGARIVSLAPGRFDTGMMALMRDADPALFPARDEFLKLKAAGKLDSADVREA
jgi:hypothetical protein